MQEILLKGRTQQLPEFGISMTPTVLDENTKDVNVVVRIDDLNVKEIKLFIQGFGTAPNKAEVVVPVVNGVGSVMITIEQPWMPYFTLTAKALNEDGSVQLIKTIHNHKPNTKYSVAYYNSLPQYITVSDSGTYTLELSSAGGDGGAYFGTRPGGAGGKGEKVTGTIKLEAGISYLITGGSGGYGGVNKSIDSVETAEPGEDGGDCYILDAVTGEPLTFMTFRYGWEKTSWKGGQGGRPATASSDGIAGKNKGQGDGSRGGNGGKHDGPNGGRGGTGSNGHIFIDKV